MKRILITNANGNLGAGITKLINDNFSPEDIELVGLVNDPICVASALCDKIISYPEECIIDGDYDVTKIVSLCLTHHIDAIIPLSDHETVVLSQHRGSLPFLFCSDYELSLDCHDKWNFQHLLETMDIERPKTWLPSQSPSPESAYLIKPRMGGLSMGIVTGSPEISQFNDDYIVQQILDGEEVTIAAYRNEDGTIWGPFVGSRKLLHGMTCYFKPIEPNQGIRHFIEQFSIQKGWKGPCNVQGMILGNDFIPFEVNLRFSGSSSLRDLLGFRDVVWAIKKWLGSELSVSWTVHEQTAIRYFSDCLLP